MKLPFIKMHGLGNDFVMFNALERDIRLTTAQICKIADRRRGVGGDGVIVIRRPTVADADVWMDYYNADGSSSVCGNGTRCTVYEAAQHLHLKSIRMQDKVTIRSCVISGDNTVDVNMGAARFGWQDVHLSQAADMARLPIGVGPYATGHGVSMGNPFAVFIVDDVAAVDLSTHGSTIEHLPLFTQRTNAVFIQILDRGHIRMRVWERGCGITEACGTGACAAAAIALKQGLVDNDVIVHLDGGDLRIRTLNNGDIMMSGPVAYSFAGEIDVDTL